MLLFNYRIDNIGGIMSNYQIAQFNAAAYTKNFAKYETSEWKKFLTSDEVKVSNSGFYGVAYINEETKEIVIANSGTNFNVFSSGWVKRLDFSVPQDFIKDLYSDAQLYFGYVPSQFKNGADKFVDKVISQLGDDAYDYNFITTGHSLGAVLSNLENAKLSALGYEVSSINIDSPGSKPIMESYVKDNHLDININNLGIVTYNVPKNLVNTTHDEIGEMYEFAMPYNNENLFGGILETINNHQFRNIINSAFDKESGDFISYKEIAKVLVYPDQPILAEVNNEAALIPDDVGQISIFF